MPDSKLTRRQLLQGLGALGAATLIGCVPRPSDQPTPAEAPGEDTPSRPTPTGSGLNFIVVMLDSLRYDHVGFYGNEGTQTPNIDAFAAESVVFDRFYAGGFPTLLNRVELFAGRYAFTYMGWEDMRGDEIVLADILNQAGYATAIVFDTWHLKHNGNSYDRGFGYSQWIRGQEGDPYRTTPLWLPLPASDEKFRNVEHVRQYLRNVSEREDEEDYFVAQVMRTAIDWLGENHDQGPFYLHVDSFDPHEPWDPPQTYVDQYDPGYVGEEVICPAYAPPDYLSAEELDHVRALYAAEVTMADHWMGELMAEIDRLGLRDNTVVMLMADHGILLGRHNAVGKSWEYRGYAECYPLYKELVHIPLMIRAPGIAPRRVASLAQPADIMPTILAWAEVGDPGTTHGVSLASTVEDTNGTAPAPRSFVMSSRSLYLPLHMKPSCTVTDGEWTLFYGGEHAPSALYYLPDDPGQEIDMLKERCDVAQAFHAEWVALLEAAGVHGEFIDPWRKPPC